MNRVIVVTYKHTGELLKVCEDGDAYNEWIDGSMFEEENVVTKSANVYEKKQ